MIKSIICPDGSQDHRWSRAKHPIPRIGRADAGFAETLALLHERMPAYPAGMSKDQLFANQLIWDIVENKVPDLLSAMRPVNLP